MKLGAFEFSSPVALAPMAGVTDLPWRKTCRQWGASFAVSEMLTSDIALWQSRKSRLRLIDQNEAGPRIVQIAGADPGQLATAAALNVERGAHAIDINMGCPAKKVCRRAAGSALLADEALVEKILRQVVAAVDVPVTLKYRTGPDRQNNNAVRIAQLAQDCGIQALALHGRSRADAFRGHAEYASVAAVKAKVQIPVLANGDISTPNQARRILEQTGVDGLLIGRGAQGRPWLFRQIRELLDHGQFSFSPTPEQMANTLLGHLDQIYAHYGEAQGVRIARKHIGWYLDNWPQGRQLRQTVIRCESAQEQRRGLASGLATMNAVMAA